MGELLERVKLSNLVNGNGIVDNYKKNSLFFFNKYRKSDNEVRSIPLSRLQAGRFYFFHYLDDSNWIRYSPVFVISIKKFKNLQIIFAVNFNFLPLEVRPAIFDNAMIDRNFDKDLPLKVKFDEVYKRLRKYGFEYCIQEYNLAQIKLCHKINMEVVPRFLYSGHPKNKYDAKRLYQIWKAKIKTRTQRDNEMSQALVTDLFEVSDEISENYKVLKNHINRLQTSIKKYGSQS